MGSSPDSERNWQKTPSDVWLGDGDQKGGIYRMDGNSFSFLPFPILNPEDSTFSITGPVTGICNGKNNRVWIASFGGVLGYEDGAFKFINDRKYAYHVRSLFEDSKGNLWIGNNGIGVLLYDGVRTINFTETFKLNKEIGNSGDLLSSGASLNHVFAIGEDQKGNIWFGDRDTGIWSYDGKAVTHYTTEDGLTSNFVRAIYTDKKGQVWVGMPDGKVGQFNGKSFIEMF